MDVKSVWVIFHRSWFSTCIKFSGLVKLYSPRTAFLCSKCNIATLKRIPIDRENRIVIIVLVMVLVIDLVMVSHNGCKFEFPK